MTLSMYQASVPVFVRSLQNLAHVLEQGAAHLTVRGDSPDAMLAMRITDDMLPLSRQVQITTDMVKNGAARLAGVELLPIADDETTYEQLQARIARVVEYLRGFDPAAIDGSEQRDIRFGTSTRQLEYTGRDYLFDFVLPNLFFHSTVAYTLLRQAGAPIGKLDFMGATAKRD